MNQEVRTEYYAWDYEMPGFYHVYDLDEEPDGVENNRFNCLYVWVSQSPEMDAKIGALVDALDAVFTLAASMEKTGP